MVLIESHKLLHWNYFLVLESDLENLSRYIEFTEDNYKTYSQEMAHLLLAAGSEVDVVLKGLCKKNDSGFKGETIDKYRKFLKPRYPKLCGLNVRLPRYGMDISPWDNWQDNKTPFWWRDYNMVKHYRDEHYNLANLKNTIASLAGLFLAVLYFYKNEAEKGELIPDPKLFMIQEDCVELHKVLDRGFLRKYIRIYKLSRQSLAEEFEEKDKYLIELQRSRMEGLIKLATEEGAKVIKYEMADSSLIIHVEKGTLTKEKENKLIEEAKKLGIGLNIYEHEKTTD